MSGLSRSKNDSERLANSRQKPTLALSAGMSYLSGSDSDIDRQPHVYYAL